MDQRKRYLEELQRLRRRKFCLPFLLNDEGTECNLHKLYQWQSDYWLWMGRLAFITAANQIGKSSIAIIKILNLAMRKALWKKYFGRATPSLFVYFYPDQRTGRVEFEEKWKKIYLPKEEYADSPEWGWEVTRDKDKNVESIIFNSGVTIHWRYFTQQTTSMQAISADYVALDEECPVPHWDEIMVRTSARAGLGSGLVSSVFTATLGQDLFYQTMEMQGDPSEKFPEAFKRQISLYDCLTYCDGSPSDVFTKERIEKDIIPLYSSDREIQRRVWGRFVKDSGLLYQEFDGLHNTENLNKKRIKDWEYWCGIDFGAGGNSGHPSTICFIAVHQDYLKARVRLMWKSGKDRITQGDLLEQYKKLKRQLNVEPNTYYDGSATDLGELAKREGVSMLPANKNHEHGVGLLNSVFETRQLKIYTGAGTGNTGDLIRELGSILESTKKNNRKDDCADALRYGLSSCPLRITSLKSKKKKKEEEEEITCERMRFYRGLDRVENKDWGESIDEQLAEAASYFSE